MGSLKSYFQSIGDRSSYDRYNDIYRYSDQKEFIVEKVRKFLNYNGFKFINSKRIKTYKDTHSATTYNSVYEERDQIYQESEILELEIDLEKLLIIIDDITHLTKDYDLLSKKIFVNQEKENNERYLRDTFPSVKMAYEQYKLCLSLVESELKNKDKK